jgi:hypothetical protein
MSHRLHGLVSGEDVEGDREGRAGGLLWPTATKQPPGGHGKEAPHRRRISPELEHPDQFPHCTCTSPLKQKNNQRQFHFNPE